MATTVEEKNYRYVAETDQIEKDVISKTVVSLPFTQFRNELDNLTLQRDQIQLRIDELRTIIALKQ